MSLLVLRRDSISYHFYLYRIIYIWRFYEQEVHSYIKLKKYHVEGVPRKSTRYSWLYYSTLIVIMPGHHGCPTNFAQTKSLFWSCELLYYWVNITFPYNSIKLYYSIIKYYRIAIKWSTLIIGLLYSLYLIENQVKLIAGTKYSFWFGFNCRF